MVTFKMFTLSTLFMQAALYGVYMVTFAHCLRWLFYEDQGWTPRRPKYVRKHTLIVALSFFLLSTASVGISLWMALAVFAKGDNGYHSLIKLFNKLNILKVRVQWFQKLECS